MLTRGVEQRLGDIVVAEQDPSAKLFIPALAGLYERLSGLSYPLIRFSPG